MDHAAMDRIVNEHFGYEAADDVDGVLATLAPGATHHLVGSPLGALSDRPHPGVLRGAVRRLRGRGRRAGGRWYGDDFLVDESLWTGQVHDARLFGLPGRSGHVTFRILHVFELTGDRIRTERVWVDMAAIAEATT